MCSVQRWQACMRDGLKGTPAVSRLAGSLLHRPGSEAFQALAQGRSGLAGRLAGAADERGQ